MGKKYQGKRWLSLFLTVTMGISMFPVTILAEKNITAEEQMAVSSNDPSLPVPVLDSETHGQWEGAYGTDGYLLCAYENTSNPNLGLDQPDPAASDRAELPDYVENIEFEYESKTNASGDIQHRYGYYLRGSYSYSEALLSGGPGSDEKKLNYRFDDRSITLHIDVNDEERHSLSLYSAELNGNTMTVQAFSADGSEALSNPVELGGIERGKYVSLPFSEDITVKLTNERHENSAGYSRINAVLSGVFFDTPKVESVVVSAEDGETLRSAGDVFAMKASVVPAVLGVPELEWSVTDLRGEKTDLAVIDSNGVVTVGQENGSFRVHAVSKEDPQIQAYADFAVMSLHGEIPAKTTISQMGKFSVIENRNSKVIFDLEKGTYSAYNQASGKAYILNAHMGIDGENSTDGYTFTAEEADIQTALTTVTPEDSLIIGKQGPVPETAENVSGKTLRLTGAKEGKPSIVLDITLQDDKTGIILRPGIINNTQENLQVKELYPLTAYGAKGAGIFAGPDPSVNHNAVSGNSVWGSPSLIRGVNMGDARNNMLISYRNNPEKESFNLAAITTYEFRSQFTTSFRENTCLVNQGRKSIDARIRLFDTRGKRVDGNSREPYMFDQAYVDFAEQNPYDSLEKFADEQARAMNVDLLEVDPYFYECLWWAQGGHQSNPDKGWGPGGGVAYGNTADFAVDEAQRSWDIGLTNYASPSLRVEPDIYTKSNEQLWWNDAKWKEFGHLTDAYPTLKEWNDKMHELNAEAGFYMQPTYRSEDFCEQNPGYMLDNSRYHNADYTDEGFINYLENSVYANMKEAGLTSLFYDYAQTYNYRTEEEEGWKSTQWYAEDWSMRPGLSWKYLLDNVEGYEDPYATAVSAYRNIYAIPKSVVGNQLQICENVWQNTGDDVAIGLVDSQRAVTDDTSFGLPLIKKGVYQWYKNRTTKMIYPDAKKINHDNQDVRRGQVTGMAMMFGKPTLAHSIADKGMSNEALYDLSRTLPMPNNGVSARPLGLFELADVQNDAAQAVGEAYDYKLDDSNHILLLWNHTGNQKNIGVKLGEDTAFGGLGLNPEKTYQVWDFWNWNYIGEVSGSDDLELPVRANECKVLAVREAKSEEPVLLSTNRHILQGELDAAVNAYDADKKVLTGTFDVIGEDGFGGDVYRAVFTVPEGLEPDSFIADAADAEVNAKYSAFDRLVEVSVDTKENYDGTDHPSLTWSLTLKDSAGKDDHQSPAAVSGVRVQSDMTGQVTLAWNESTDDSGQVRYRVYRGTDGASVDKLVVDNLESAACTLTEEGTVYYRVEAYDPSGNTSSSEVVKAEVVLTKKLEMAGAQASSKYPGNYGAENAIDGNHATIWHTGNGDSERSITIQLQKPETVNGLFYLPRQDTGSDNGTITKYEIQVSTDGTDFTPVADGNWKRDRSWKSAAFSGAEQVTHVKLIALEGVSGFGSAAEIYITYVPDALSGIAVSDSSVTLQKGTTCQIYANLYPSHIQREDLIWESEDETVAMVDHQGMITGISAGTTKVTVTVNADGKTYTDSAVITVTDQGESLVFDDVEKDAWFYDDVNYVSANGIMTGLTDTCFGPAEATTRAQFATILYRMAGCPETEYQEKFADVKEGEFYTDAVMWASANGIVTGYADTGRYEPDRKISREELSVMLCRYAKFCGQDVAAEEDLSAYEDGNSVSGFAKESMSWAVANHVIKGADGKRLNPQSAANRAECAAMIHRYMKENEK